MGYLAMMQLMMKILVLICTFLFTSSACYSEEVTTYYFIRHAEKVRIDKSDDNPALNYDGVRRANNWKETFSRVKLDAIYSTDYKRTQLTATPTADSKNLPVLLYDSSDMYSASFQHETKGKSVLVVGHSNTTNVFANKVLGLEQYKQINGRNNSNLISLLLLEKRLLLSY